MFPFSSYLMVCVMIAFVLTGLPNFSSYENIDAVCPNCAAELNITMAGECEYCGSKLTSGDFDWVLSEIQQDEEYTG